MSFFEGIWLKQCLLRYLYEQIGLLQAFLGSNTHFLAGYAYFFSSEYKPQLIYQNPRKNKRTFQVKKWGFDPKICFQGSYSFSDVFLGSNAHFLTSYNHFLASGSFFFGQFHEIQKNKAQRPTMRPQEFLGISSYRDARMLESYFDVIPDFVCLLDHFCT